MCVYPEIVTDTVELNGRYISLELDRHSNCDDEQCSRCGEIATDFTWQRFKYATYDDSGEELDGDDWNQMVEKYDEEHKPVVCPFDCMNPVVRMQHGRAPLADNMECEMVSHQVDHAGFAWMLKHSLVKGEVCPNCQKSTGLWVLASIYGCGEEFDTILQNSCNEDTSLLSPTMDHFVKTVVHEIGDPMDSADQCQMENTYTPVGYVGCRSCRPFLLEGIFKMLPMEDIRWKGVSLGYKTWTDFLSDLGLTLDELKSAVADSQSG